MLCLMNQHIECDYSNNVGGMLRISEIPTSHFYLAQIFYPSSKLRPYLLLCCRRDFDTRRNETKYILSNEAYFNIRKCGNKHFDHKQIYQSDINH